MRLFFVSEKIEIISTEEVQVEQSETYIDADGNEVTETSIVTVTQNVTTYIPIKIEQCFYLTVEYRETDCCSSNYGEVNITHEDMLIDTIDLKLNGPGIPARGAFVFCLHQNQTMINDACLQIFMQRDGFSDDDNNRFVATSGDHTIQGESSNVCHPIGKNTIYDPLADYRCWVTQVFDDYGDGMCCLAGQGFLLATYDNTVIFYGYQNKTGGNDWKKLEFTFCIHYVDEERALWQPGFGQAYVEVQIIQKVDGEFFDTELNLHYHQYRVKRFTTTPVDADEYVEEVVRSYQLIKEWNDET